MDSEKIFGLTLDQIEKELDHFSAERERVTFQIRELNKRLYHFDKKIDELTVIAYQLISSKKG